MTMKYDLNEMIADMEKRLKKKRFIHSVGVMYTAEALAMAHDVDIESAGVAGILHDMAKEMKDNEYIKYCQKNDLAISSDERKMPFLLHGKVAAHMAKVKYGIDNEEILDAITYHTTGKPAMSKLAQIIYLADFIEPNRKPLKVLPEIRKVSFYDLNRACAITLKNTIAYIEESDNKSLDRNSKYAYDYYKEFCD